MSEALAQPLMGPGARFPVLRSCARAPAPVEAASKAQASSGLGGGGGGGSDSVGGAGTAQEALKTGRRRKLKRARRAAPRSGRGGGKVTEESAEQPRATAPGRGPGLGARTVLRSSGVGPGPSAGRDGPGPPGGGVAVRISSPIGPHPASVRPASTCTNTRLSAGTSSSPARRGKASSASDSSRLKGVGAAKGPGAAGNGGSGGRKSGTGEEGPRCLSVPPADLPASPTFFGRWVQLWWRIHLCLTPSAIKLL